MKSNNPVYVVEDETGIRNSLRFLLTASGREVRSFVSGGAFLAEAMELKSGPVLLDMELHDVDGMAILNRMTDIGCNLPIAFLIGNGDTSLAIKAMQKGAVDFLLMPFSHANLISLLANADAKIAGGEALVRQRRIATAQLSVLTAREAQVLNELARGLSNKIIAEDLDISYRTVEVHRANLLRKLGAENFPAALRIAFAAGMPFAALDAAPDQELLFTLSEPRSNGYGQQNGFCEYGTLVKQSRYK